MKIARNGGPATEMRIKSKIQNVWLTEFFFWQFLKIWHIIGGFWRIVGGFWRIVGGFWHIVGGLWQITRVFRKIVLGFNILSTIFNKLSEKMTVLLLNICFNINLKQFSPVYFSRSLIFQPLKSSLEILQTN